MRKTNLAVLLCSAVCFWGGTTKAQQPMQSQVESSGPLQEIIVTARKREESLLDVPVTETAIAAPKLEQLAITDIGGLTSVVPGLVFGKYVAGQGSQVAIRGIGAVAEDPGIDQSVELNLDGLPLNTGMALLSSFFDLQQVEVLKGPQSLFYGKSTTAGVISIHTADPTDKTEVIARANYGFVARNPEGELIVSGPINDTLKVRLAGMYSHSEGYFDNLATGLTSTGAEDPRYSRAPRTDSFVIRGTAIWTPSDRLDAHLKINVVQDKENEADTTEYKCPGGISAPSGIPFLGGGLRCGLGKDLWMVGLNPAAFSNAIPNGGSPFQNNYQKFGTLELNYHLTDHLGLSSTTAYYQNSQLILANATETTYAAPALAGVYQFGRHDFTQELRLNSDFNTPYNFMLGAFYEDGQLHDHITVLGNTFYQFPGLLLDQEPKVPQKSYSVFGQLRWKIVPQLELAAGLRWADETRTETVYSYFTTPASPAPVVDPRIHTSKVMPDVTLTEKATDDLTLYAAFRDAYKSGAFVVGATPTANGYDNAVGDEKAVGGEAGIKSRLLDEHLLLNAATYYYHYSGLQVGVALPPPPGSLVPAAAVENAASARSYGLDLDGAYTPPGLEGLQLNGAINWNKAKFLTLNDVPCWGGQTIALGCNQILNQSTGLYSAQQLSGQPLVRAPEWQLNFGFNYTMPIADKYQLIIANNNMYSSKYTTFLAANFPGNANYQTAYMKSDVSLTLQAPGDHWELALIGNNITDKVIASACANADYLQGAVLNTEVTGGPTTSPVHDEAGCFAEPGREIWLRLTLKPF